jgi:hypothetical protein
MAHWGGMNLRRQFQHCHFRVCRFPVHDPFHLVRVHAPCPELRFRFWRQLHSICHFVFLRWFVDCWQATVVYQPALLAAASARVGGTTGLLRASRSISRGSTPRMWGQRNSRLWACEWILSCSTPLGIFGTFTVRAASVSDRFHVLNAFRHLRNFHRLWICWILLTIGRVLNAFRHLRNFH